MFHDKVSLTHHNLGSSVETPRDAAITLGYGFSMINFAYEHFFNNVKGTATGLNGSTASKNL
ncbi:MAG: hypothetical protein ACLUKN_12275 [Bacilli bacterium]